MKTLKNFLSGLVVILSCVACKDDDLNCTTNSIVVNDGRQACVTMEVTRYEAQQIGEPEILFMRYSSNEIGTMDINLNSSLNQTLEEGQTYDWLNGLNFSSISGEQINAGSLVVTRIDRNAGRISFYFEVKAVRVNNNIYTISGTTTDLPFN